MDFESYLDRVSQHTVMLVDLPKEKQGTESSLIQLESRISKRTDHNKHIIIY